MRTFLDVIPDISRAIAVDDYLHHGDIPSYRGPNVSARCHLSIRLNISARIWQAVLEMSLPSNDSLPSVPAQA